MHMILVPLIDLKFLNELAAGRRRNFKSAALVLPAERDFIQALGAEFFRRARDRTAAERAVEADRRSVIGERPDDEAFQPALRKVAPRRREQAAAKAEPLKFRTEVKLVDLAVVEQAAGACGPANSK